MKGRDYWSEKLDAKCKPRERLEVPRRPAGRTYQTFCDEHCRRGWWKMWWGPARQRAIEARDKRKWGAAKIARWLSTPEFTVTVATARKLLGQPRRRGRKRKGKKRPG